MDSLEGRVIDVREIGFRSEENDYRTSTLPPTPYTILEVETQSGKTEELDFPMHLDPRLVCDSYIRYKREGSGFMDGKFTHVLVLADNDYEGLTYRAPG